MTNAAKFKNFAESTIEEYFDVGDLSLVINSDDTAKFPTALSGGDYFFLTCFDGENAPEIVKVTAVSGTTFTVLRGQESSGPRAWEAGSYVRLAMTAAQAEDAIAAILDHETRIDTLEGTSAAALSGDFLFCHGFLA